MLSSSALPEVQTLTDEALQALTAAVLQQYAARIEAGHHLPIVPSSTITATEAMISTTAILRAVNVQLFELGLWQAWAQ
jgi:hypothetical protein